MGTLFLVGRILFGGFFFVSGLNHFLNLKAMAGYAAAHQVPSPTLMVALSGALILLGGLSVLLGVLPRWGLGMIALFLVLVTIQMHAYWTVSDPALRMADSVNFMKNTALLGSALALMMVPLPWPLSLDTALRRGRPKTTPRGEIGPPIAHG